MRYFYACVALFATTAIAGPVGLRSTPDAEKTEDLVDLGLLGNGYGNNHGGGGISIKRDENAQDNGIGPIEVGTPVLDITNP